MGMHSLCSGWSVYEGGNLMEIAGYYGDDYRDRYVIGYYDDDEDEPEEDDDEEDEDDEDDEEESEEEVPELKQKK